MITKNTFWERKYNSMVWNKNTIVIESVEDDSVRVKLESGKEITLNIDNIYDIIENTPMGTSEFFFVRSDDRFPALQITVSNSGKSINTQVLFMLNDADCIPVADKSPTGLIKWLKRTIEASEGNYNYFEINIRG